MFCLINLTIMKSMNKLYTKLQKKYVKLINLIPMVVLKKLKVCLFHRNSSISGMGKSKVYDNCQSHCCTRID